MNKKIMSLITVMFATAGGLLLIKKAGELMDMDIDPFGDFDE